VNALALPNHAPPNLAPPNHAPPNLAPPNFASTRSRRRTSRRRTSRQRARAAEPRAAVQSAGTVTGDALVDGADALHVFEGAAHKGLTNPAGLRPFGLLTPLTVRPLPAPDLLSGDSRGRLAMRHVDVLVP
jgi:hypothetical protein